MRGEINGLHGKRAIPSKEKQVIEDLLTIAGVPIAVSKVVISVLSFVVWILNRRGGR